MTDCACNPWCVRYAGHIGGCSPTPLERDVPGQGAPHDPRDRFCNDANVCAEVVRLRAENERQRELIQAIAKHPSGTSRAGESMRRWARHLLETGQLEWEESRLSFDEKGASGV